MLLASLAEILSIGTVLPFLGVLTAPERVFAHPAAQPLIQALELTEPRQLLLPLTIGFGAAALTAGAIRLLLLWASTRISFAVGADLGMSIYRRTLYQPYAVHVARNSSEVISGISGKANSIIYNAVLPALTIVSSGVMLLIILATLLIVEPFIALVAFGGFGLIYTLIISLTRKKLLADSQCMAKESVQVIKALQEGLGGIRDVLIDGSQDAYCKVFQKADLSLRRAQGSSAFISTSPRYAVEALGMLLIIALAYTLANETDGIGRAIPILGGLALAALRLLPVLQQAYGSWTSIRSGQSSLQDTIELLDQPLPAYAAQPTTQALSFKHSISLNNLGFRYTQQTPYVLKKIDLTIEKGSRVGFIGATGSGKSTLLDILMGLLRPTDGSLEIDGQVVTPSNGRAWQARIAHVPQSIYLSDSTIAENIAFGLPREQIDGDRLRQVAQKAQISDTIEAWAEQYDTVVGERGVRLSGGQRQRIGIARALYKNADVVILDEATSALDNETESEVMRAIEGLGDDLTVIIVAHRVTTLRNCTKIIELRHGSITRIGSYEEIVGLNSGMHRVDDGIV